LRTLDTIYLGNIICLKKGCVMKKIYFLIGLSFFIGNYFFTDLLFAMEDEGAIAEEGGDMGEEVPAEKSPEMPMPGMDAADSESTPSEAGSAQAEGPSAMPGMGEPLEAEAAPAPDMGMPEEKPVEAEAAPAPDMGMPEKKPVEAEAAPASDMGVPAEEPVEAEAAPAPDMGMPEEEPPAMPMPGMDAADAEPTPSEAEGTPVETTTPVTEITYEQPKWPQALEIKEEGQSLVGVSWKENFEKLIEQATQVNKNIQDIVAQLRKLRLDYQNKYRDMDSRLDTFFQKTGFTYGELKKKIEIFERETLKQQAVAVPKKMDQ
jgi:hypothetical protein